MKIYTYTVELIHDVRITEYITVTVEAEHEVMAEGMAIQSALNKAGGKSPCGGEILETDVGDIWLEDFQWLRAPPGHRDSFSPTGDRARERG